MSSSDTDDPDFHRKHKLVAAGENFVARADATATLISMAREHVAESPPLPSNLDFLSEAQQDDYGTALRELGESLESAVKNTKEDAQVDPDEKRGGEPRSITIEIADKTAAAATFELLRQMAHFVRKPSTDNLLRRSVLVLMVSDFESLIADIIRQILYARPKIGTLDETTLTLAEMEAFETVQAARSALIERKVDDLMRCSLADWEKWFNRIKINWRELVDNWSEFAEIFARRNIYVHADGRASQQYINSLQGSHAEIPEVGDLIPLTDEYLESSLDTLVSFGTLLVGATLLQLWPRSTKLAAGWHVDQAQLAINEERPKIALQVCSTALKSSRDEWGRSRIAAIKIVRWLALKDLERGAEVIRDVTDWDVDGLDLAISHAKTVLLEDHTTAASQVKQLMDRGSLTVIDLLGKRLYRDLLQDFREELLPLAKDLPTEVEASREKLMSEITDENSLENGASD